MVAQMKQWLPKKCYRCASITVEHFFDPKLPGEKKENIHAHLSTASQGLIEHVCIYAIKIYLQKTAWTFGVLCGKHV